MIVSSGEDCFAQGGGAGATAYRLEVRTSFPTGEPE